MLLRWIRRPIKEGTQTRGMAGILSFFPAEVIVVLTTNAAYCYSGHAFCGRYAVCWALP